jgi:hypothetical protein
MNGRSFPNGQANSGLLKALHRTLVAEKGMSAADAWLRSIRMVRADFTDETRTVPLSALHRALVAFAEVASRDAIPRAWKYLVAPDSLGVWVRVLRGTTEPAEAFARLDAADSQYGRTTRWETTATRRGWWRGRVTVAHDPGLEADGLLRLARLAELAAVPALFGYPGATARAVVAEAPSPSAARGKSNPPPDLSGMVQEYEVVWAVPDAVSSGAVGGIVGLAAGAIPLLAHVGAFGLYALVAGVAGATGSLAGIVSARERLRRADNHAQQTRVHALERNLSLRESHEGGVGARLEGSVAAGQYRILQRMGAGATGVIYEAVRISDGQRVAIKLLRVAAAHDAVASEPKHSACHGTPTS